MKTAAVMALAALAGGASVTVAGPTWTPDNTYGDSYVDARAVAGTGNGHDRASFNAFGIHTASTSIDNGSTTNTFDWNANGASNLYTISASSIHARSQSYTALTVLIFVADTGGEFNVNLAFDWQGTGQDTITTFFRLFDYETFAYDEASDTVESGSVSTSYTGTLVAGRRYQAYYSAYVHGSGELSGNGSGTTDITLSTIPLPTASAMAALGLLGLGVRRRRVSL